MVIIPLQSVPSQALSVTLNGQICQVHVYQKPRGIFLDLLLRNSVVVAGVLCENLNPVVRSLYLGFSGDLAFIDQQGSDDPLYTGLGSRWVLSYLTAAEMENSNTVWTLALQEQALAALGSA